MSINYAGRCVQSYRSAISFIKLCFFAGRAFELHSFNDSEGMDEEEREAFLEAFRLVIVSISLAFWNIPLRCEPDC